MNAIVVILQCIVAMVLVVTVLTEDSKSTTIDGESNLTNSTSAADSNEGKIYE